MPFFLFDEGRYCDQSYALILEKYKFIRGFCLIRGFVSVKNATR